MRSRLHQLAQQTGHVLSQLFTGPQVFALLPVVILAAFWLGGEMLLIVAAIVLPLLLACLSAFRPRPGRAGTDDATGCELLKKELDEQLRQSRGKAMKSACMLVAIDDHDELVGQHGHTAGEEIAESIMARLRADLRTRDKVLRLDEGRFAITVAPVRHFDLDTGLQMAVRLQLAVERPLTLDGTSLYVSASVGFCIGSQLPYPSAAGLVDGAFLALSEARRHGPSAIRSFSNDMRSRGSARSIQNEDVIRALENGEITTWFQPQISTHTGAVSGFESLARWMHPERGMIPPAEFLPLLEESAKLERLGEVMLHNALSALTSWDMQGFDIPHVGVNFSPDELRNPRLPEKVEWELDRFELTPDRLVVEILETVVATSPDDMVVRNINAFSALGCAIDLDDFGTGHASISSLRRFAIQRLKIDRSFVMKVDQDPDQQRMVSAILLMAERLNLDTLAEGVETAGEHTMLAQLGCGHVQGFGIARPMPFEKTAAWISEHGSRLSVPPITSRKFG